MKNDIWNFWHSISLIHSIFIKILLPKRKPGFGPKFKRKLPKKRRFVYLYFWRTTNKVLFFSNLKDTRQAINAVMFCVIWYHLYNFKNVKKYPWRSVTFIKVAGFYPATLLKSNIPPWVFFTFLKLYKWYQIAQRIIYSTFRRSFLSPNQD